MRRVSRQTSQWRRSSGDLARTFRTQSCAPGDSRVCSVMGHQEWDLRAAGIDAPGREAIFYLIEEWAEHGGHSAAHDEYVGVEQVHYVAQPSGQEFNRFLKNLFGEQVSCGVRLADHLTCRCFNISDGEIEDHGFAGRCGD